MFSRIFWGVLMIVLTLVGVLMWLPFLGAILALLGGILALSLVLIEGEGFIEDYFRTRRIDKFFDNYFRSE